MLQILIHHISKLKQRVLGSLITLIFSSMIILAWLNCYKRFCDFIVLIRYSICVISFFNLYGLFPAFICDNNIASFVNNLFGINIFNPVPVFSFSRNQFHSFINSFFWL